MLGTAASTGHLDIIGHVIRGSLSSPTNKARSQAAQTQLQKKQQEKAMSKREFHLNNIHNAKVNEDSKGRC